MTVNINERGVIGIVFIYSEDASEESCAEAEGDFWRFFAFAIVLRRCALPWSASGKSRPGLGLADTIYV